MTTRNVKGSLVISLDFEMMWGCHDWTTPEEYGRTNIKQIRIVINRLLNLFERYDIHVTFACVGMLMCNNKEDLLRYIPENKPSYYNQKWSPYKENYINSISQSELFYASDIIAMLKLHERVEIASHTFSHYFCWEEGQTLEEFDADIKSAIKVAIKHGIKLDSIIFPRNQVNIDYLYVCSKYGISRFRGIAPEFSTKPENRFNEIRQRVGRLFDSYVNISGCATIKYSDIIEHSGVTNVPASRFLRPYNRKLALFDSLKLRRIKKEITQAAQNGELYHLWWHPHNFGNNIEKNMMFLEKILKHYKYCREEYGMNSFTIKEFTEFIK